MKKRILITFILLICLIVPSVLVIAENSQDQKQNEQQDAILKNVQSVVKNLNKLAEYAEKIFKELEPAQKSVTFSKNVLSFETLDQLEKYSDLPKYGLVQPQQYNHNSGKNLVLLALRATSYFKGPWVLAHGLLGVNMLETNVHDRIGYKSLFLRLTQRHKMCASNLSDDNTLLVDRVNPKEEVKSIIAKREAVIYSVSNQLEGRYIYNNEGKFARNYLPERTRKSNNDLKQILVIGLHIYAELNRQGFDDYTLRDTLGMAYASLVYDGVVVDYEKIGSLGTLQLYQDALEATLKKLREKPNHSYRFLHELSWEMDSRSLNTSDEILSPSNDKNYQAILKIVEADLNHIRQPQTKATGDMTGTEEIVFTGIPKIKILIENGSQRTPEKLSQAKSIEYKCTITKMDNKYYWATRENVELIPIQSGAYTIFIATNGAGYVRIIDPEAKKILSKKGEQPYDYMEHLLLGLSTISYYGTSK